MQLMPATAAGLGVTDAYDPYQNIMGGAKYIRQMLDKYNGNCLTCLATYKPAVIMLTNMAVFHRLQKHRIM